MNIHRIISQILIFGVLLFLIGCQSTKVPALTLISNGVEVEKWTALDKNQTVELPISTLENQVFVGWSDGTQMYFDSYTFVSTATLTAVFESVDEMFTYTILPSIEFSDAFKYEIVSIDTYIGDAQSLVVPSQIDGKYVVSIKENAFKDTSIVNVKLPVDIVLGASSFSDISTLRSVTFYGDYVIPYEAGYNQEEYDQLLQDYASTCSFKGGDLVHQAYPYGNDCPVLEVLSTQSFVIGGKTYTTYQVLINPELILKPMRFTFTDYTFSGSIHIDTLEIPKGETQFRASIVAGLKNLDNIIVSDDHPYYRWVDGVLFNRELTRLVFYPSTLTQTSYTLPNDLNSITIQIDNDYLETLIIPADYQGDFDVVGLVSLKEILVEKGNGHYQSIDGVLYTNNTLVKYPAKKAGSSFTVPAFVRTINSFAFSQNQHLETLILPELLTTIEFESFIETKSLLVLEVPNNVLYIGYSAFRLSSIEALIIHRSQVIQGSITSTAGSLGITDITNFIIYVPDDSLDAYKSALGYTQFESIILPLSQKP